MLFMFQNKDKDLLGIYQYGCDPFCVTLLTDRHFIYVFGQRSTYVCALLVASRVARKKVSS